MSINYQLIIVVMMFVILISIQFTLNKIYLVLKDIRERLNLERLRKD